MNNIMTGTKIINKKTGRAGHILSISTRLDGKTVYKVRWEKCSSVILAENCFYPEILNNSSFSDDRECPYCGLVTKYSERYDRHICPECNKLFQVPFVNINNTGNDMEYVRSSGSWNCALPESSDNLPASSSFFDYSVLDIETQEFLSIKERSIKSRTIQAIVDNGKDFIEVKERLSHGLFESWLDSCFDMSVRTAQRYMKVAREFKNDNVSFLENFSKSALFILSSKDTPPEAKQEALDLAASGEKITQQVAEQLKEKNRQLSDDNEKYYRAMKEALSEVGKKQEQIIELEDKLQSITDKLGASDSESAQVQYEKLETDLSYYRSQVVDLKSKLSELEKSKIEVVEKEVIKEKDVVVEPDDYQDLKSKVDSFVEKIDDLNAKLSKERKALELSNTQKEFASSLAIIHQAVDMIFEASSKIPEDQILNISLAFQHKCYEAKDELSRISPYGNDMIIRNRDSLKKLLNAHFKIYRPDEEKKKISVFDDSKFVWKLYKKYDTKKELRADLKDLVEDSLNIIA